MNARAAVAVAACGSLLLNLCAQEPQIRVDGPAVPVFIRPWSQAHVPPVRLSNSNHLHDLIRAGKLYLTVQDAIAVAIENNLDLEVDRYGPLVSDWAVERAEAGGTLPGVPSGNSQIGQVASGQGVEGSQRAAGVSGGGGGGTGRTGGAIISQIGPVTPNLDPVLRNVTVFSHTTTPQENAVQSQVTALVDTTHIYSTTLQQGLITGGNVQLTDNESYLKQNAPTDVLNPSVAPVLQLYIQHPLANGFGVAVNSRFIRVAKNNAAAARFTFQSQLLNLVSNVLNLYWDLVSDHEDLKTRQHAADMAQKFYEDTKTEIGLGVLPRVDIYAAEAEAATRKRELTLSAAAIRQQENLLKNALSRNGMQDPLVDSAEVVPLDSIQVAAADDLAPLRTLVETAMAKRPDLAVTRLNGQSAEISALGTRSGVLPNIQVFASAYNSGLAGTPNPQAGQADPYFVGGYGTALGQVFRRNFPNQNVGGYIVGRFGNHISQGDYGIDQLQLQQTTLTGRRELNQLVVDISNYVVALRQARSRYSAAVDTRKLQQELLQKTQQSFSLGTATLNDIIVVQRALAAAETAEVATLATYSHARVSLDQVLGETLEKNHVSVGAAFDGRGPIGPPAHQ
ncbi:MAG TPA: TolC family protein [Bryobacteraceae bacterium]|nr:TolC family protein [Bryobacteraceae bacterium]